MIFHPNKLKMEGILRTNMGANNAAEAGVVRLGHTGIVQDDILRRKDNPC
jgi:hypothetical protein